MIAMVDVTTVLAIISIAGLIAFLVANLRPHRSAIVAEGVLEEVDCVDFISPKASMIYRFATPYRYRFRDQAEERTFYFEAIRHLPLSANNQSGGYVPKTGECIRIIARYNFFSDLIAYKIEKLPDWDPETKVLDPMVFPEYPDF